MRAIGMLRQGWRSRLVRALSMVGLLAGAAAVAQVATGPEPQFCYQGATQQCANTLDKAEQAMRADSVHAPVATLLEQAETNVIPAQERAEYVYRVKDQPGTLYTGGFTVDAVGSDGDLISGGHGCARGSDPNLPNRVPTKAIWSPGPSTNIARSIRPAPSAVRVWRPICVSPPTGRWMACRTSRRPHTGS